jgi:hypothetical protein
MTSEDQRPPLPGPWAPIAALWIAVVLGGVGVAIGGRVALHLFR